LESPVPVFLKFVIIRRSPFWLFETPPKNWWFSWKNQQGTGGFHKWSFQNWWVVLTQGYLIGSLIFSKPWLTFIQNYRELPGIFVLLLITGKIWMSIWDGNCSLECKVFFRRNQGPTEGCPNNSYTKFLRECAWSFPLIIKLSSIERRLLMFVLAPCSNSLIIASCSYLES
jgi:hypothetical protein